MEYAELKALWQYALSMLYKKDRRLLRYNVHERTIACRLALYLQLKYDPCFMKRACIDVEYNREGKEIKRPYIDSESGWIAPDIILHERDNQENNIFYCEVKKKSKNNNDDAIRVKNALRGKRSYEYGINLYSLTSKEANLSFYKLDGLHIIEEEFYFDAKEKQLKSQLNTNKTWIYKDNKWEEISSLMLYVKI